MPIPVIISANNEASRIERTLTTLAHQSADIEPLVVVNGCTDNTADVARATGAMVIESEHGKMRAIQAGLEYLGKSALEPVLLLDGDTRPFSKKWSSRLVAELVVGSDDRPGIVWGPVIFKDDVNTAVGTAISLYTSKVSWDDRHDDDPRTIRGCNTGLRLQNDKVLEEILALDNYWPREDVAIYDTIMQTGGGVSKTIFKPEAWVNTSGHRFQIMRKLREQLKGRQKVHELADDAYDTRTPEGAEPYNSPYTRHPHKNRNLVDKK